MSTFLTKADTKRSSPSRRIHLVKKRGVTPHDVKGKLETIGRFYGPGKPVDPVFNDLR